MVKNHFDYRPQITTEEMITKQRMADAKLAKKNANQEKLKTKTLLEEKQSRSTEEYRQYLRTILTSRDPKINPFSQYYEYYRTAIRISNLRHLTPERKADKLRKGIDNIPMSLEMSEYIRTFPELVDDFDKIWKLKNEIL